MLKIDLEPAYILHARAYRETSLLLEVFTKNHGRVSLIAKGAKGPKSRARGILQVFVPLLISCCGKGELLTLTAFEKTEPATVLKGRTLASAFYVTELIMRLVTRWDPHPELFEVYHRTILELGKESKDSKDFKDSIDIEKHNLEEQKVLRLFEKALLKTIGYELQLTADETGSEISENSFYFFDPERGFSYLEKGLSTRNFQSKVLSSGCIFQGRTLHALQSGILEDNTILLEAKRLMRRALAPHLGSKPLESRRLIVS